MCKHFPVFSLLLLFPLSLLSGNNTGIAPVVSYLLSDTENKDLGRIMPLGDSITWDGRRFSDSRPDGLLQAYRSHLWWKLEATGYTMDFIGSRSNGSAVIPHFDGDNEGHSGWTSYQIASNVSSYLNKYPVDIILLHIGTNDAMVETPMQTVRNIEYILNRIDDFENNKGVTIKVILAKIIRYPAYAAWVSSFNVQLEAMAQKRMSLGDGLVVVDMETNAGLNYSFDLIDGVHPTNCGYEKMANTWYKAITGKEAPKLQYCN